MDCMKTIKFFVLLCLTLTLGLASDCLPPPAGLVGWWPGDGSGDALLAGGPATPQSGATYTNGISGQAFLFDGLDDYVATTLDVQPSAMPYSTWEAWVYPTRPNHGTRQQIFSTDD